MKLKEVKKSKGIVLGFVGRETSNEKRRECNNSQISIRQLDQKFGTNSSFSSSFSFPWKGSAPALLVGSSTPVIELQFLKR